MSKKFSEILIENEELLKEESGPIGTYQVVQPEQSSIDNFDLHRVEDPEVLTRLNTFVGSVANLSHTNVNTALNSLYQRLLRGAGISFDREKIEKDSGSLKLPLMQFGGIFDALTGQWLDGISHRMEDGKGLELDFKWKRNDVGGFTINAEIVKRPAVKRDTKKKSDTKK